MISLLLLDLDGVVVFETVPPQAAKLEIILLHDMLDQILVDLGLPVIVVTHRSRAEAAFILRTASLTGRGIAGVIAAEDIFGVSLSSPRRLLRHGLQKSRILPKLERQFHVARNEIAFIDDRRDILEDAVRNGLGLGLHAPSGIDGADLISFNFQQIITLLKHPPPYHAILELRPNRISLDQWRRTGISTTGVSRHSFNALRHLWRRSRTAIGAMI
jgi:hypothetical protein